MIFSLQILFSITMEIWLSKEKKPFFLELHFRRKASGFLEK